MPFPATSCGRWATACARCCPKSSRRQALGMSADARHRKGLDHLREGRIDAAVAELQHALRLEPANPEYAKTLGNAYKAGGNLHAAIDSYRRALHGRPDHVPALYNLGVCLRELGQPKEAEVHFRRILELDP